MVPKIASMKTLFDVLSERIRHYYTSIPSIQKDFITSPHICSLFGEAIACTLLNTVNEEEYHSPILWVECGPGEGVLMKQMLHVFQFFPHILKRLSLFSLEMNPYFQKIQKNICPNLHFINRIEDLYVFPPSLLWIVGNEFLDAFPIRQFKYGQECLEHESFTHTNVHEYSPLTLAFIDQINMLLRKHRGYGLFIDYGYDIPYRIGSTLQGIKNHQQTLDEGGDISHLVDFYRLQERLEHPSMITTQRDFLSNAGIEARLEQLRSRLDPHNYRKLLMAVMRLMGPMGDLFKVWHMNSF
jgi:NADH dehydrogenase [ubiquinone] 1 alpha subcomplex assembly factor 7